jgi:oligo-1,6-glucosidase
MNDPWWKNAVIYQIYPRSFMDSNGDGIGDLQGIVRKLDYLQDLGVNAVWLSPIYASPNDDNGYDISDYYRIMPEFGTMDDFDDMLEQMHRRGIRLLMDLVVNHTSDEHPWFVESRSSKDNPKRDWYIWRPPRNGREPNNWSSYFCPSAWEFDERTGEYYLHLFSKKQPDLNWENPKLRQAIYEMMGWWFDKGIDGFRMDVINFLAKAPGFPDALGEGKTVFPGPLITNQPGMHEILRQMRRRVLRRYDVMTVGECHMIDVHEGLKYAARHRQELDTVFQFEISWAANDVALLKRKVKEWYEVFDGQAHGTVTLANHDWPRLVSRCGCDGPHRMQSAKLLATFLLTAPGTPFLYQGDEIGMTNVCFPSIEHHRDIETLNRFRERLESGMDVEQAFAAVQFASRDNARTPMHWDDSNNAGFSTGTPWIGINPNYQDINVARELREPGSILAYYRQLLRIRKRHPALVSGTYRELVVEPDPLYLYLREHDGVRVVVVLNFSSGDVAFTGPAEFPPAATHLLIGNYPDHLGQMLRPWEARVYRYPPTDEIADRRASCVNGF